VSGVDNPVYWECTSKDQPPATLLALLEGDETLLWSARLSSELTAGRHLIQAMLSLLAALFFAAVAPWTQTVAEYCGPEPSGRCRVLAYIVWPALAFVAIASLLSFWSAWRATHRPWMITYGLSDRRAFFVNERRQKDYRYLYLRLSGPKLVRARSLAFEGGTLAFVGLPPEEAARAFNWATTGRTTKGSG
jgi:hypothetical protein